MASFLILNLKGPMQAWGTHTFEDFRPGNLFPTRSGMLGLLGACLGIDRRDHTGLDQLASSLEFTVKVDHGGIKLSDYHTINEARRANRKPKEGETVQTRREYLFDASFHVAVGQRSNALFSLDTIAEAVKKPVYTPSLGRRSCPLSAPLSISILEAETGKAALELMFGTKGVFYAENKSLDDQQCLMLRDVPMHGKSRRFGTRMVYIHAESKEVRDVSQPS
jgi:CRISPR system Cascade subunit CasD